MVLPPYQVAARLVGIASDHWEAIDGEAAHSGVDFFQLPFDRFLNAIYWWAVQRVKDTDKFARDLDQPFPLPMSAWTSETTVTEADLTADGESFMAFAAAFGVRPPRVDPGPADDAHVPSTPNA